MMGVKWFAATALVLVLGAGGVWAVERGLQTCGWLDLILGRSGCLGTVRLDRVVMGRGNLDTPFTATGHAIVAVEASTADGWRNGLLVFDPVSGTEQGRYPVPLSNTNMRLLPSPDGKTLLLLCGMVEGNCTETGGDGVLVDRDNFQAFRPAPKADRTLHAFPGEALPDADYGFDAHFALGGERIVTNRQGEGVLLLDADGERIAGLSERFDFTAKIVVSPDGSRILRWQPNDRNGDRLQIWSARDGRELGRLDGGPSWTLRAAPFWSADSTMIFTPRQEGAAMLVDQFQAP